MSRLFTRTNSEYLEVASAVKSGSPVTLACWMRRTDSTAQCLMGIKNNGSAGQRNCLLIELGTITTNRLTARRGAPGGSVQATASAGTGVSTWHHAAATFGSSSFQIYMDGGNSDSTNNNTSPSGLNVTTIGRESAATPLRYFDGDIAEAGIWSVALTSGEVAMLAAGVRPTAVRPDALLAYWPLYGRHSPEIDPRGRFDLTVNGATAADHPRIHVPVMRLGYWKAGAAGAQPLIPKPVLQAVNRSAVI